MKSTDWLRTVGRSIGSTGMRMNKASKPYRKAAGPIAGGLFTDAAAGLGNLGRRDRKMGGQQILNRGYRRMGYMATGTVGGTGGAMYARHRRRGRSSGTMYNR